MTSYKIYPEYIDIVNTLFFLLLLFWQRNATFPGLKACPFPKKLISGMGNKQNFWAQLAMRSQGLCPAIPKILFQGQKRGLYAKISRLCRHMSTP